MKAHVICCNDSVQHVVIGSEEQAEKKRKELKKSYFKRNKHNFNSAEEYALQCFWHIHTVHCDNHVTDTYNKVINFAIETDEPASFLRVWREGSWDTIDKEWPEFNKEN